MSEEEKKAIEILKQPPDFSLSYYNRENAIDIVLNLIEKQQEELNKEKEKNKELENKLQSFKYLGMEEMIDKYFVDKDKIKAKVIEIKNKKAENDFITTTQGKLDTIIALESLLEESN